MNYLQFIYLGKYAIIPKTDHGDKYEYQGHPKVFAMV